MTDEEHSPRPDEQSKPGDQTQDNDPIPETDDPYAWMRAKGILVGILPDELPEVLLRRIRGECE